MLLPAQTEPFKATCLQKIFHKNTLDRQNNMSHRTTRVFDYQTSRKDTMYCIFHHKTHLPTSLV